ncbi:MAG: hydantoinase/oxoprolinase family protein [Spirochaetota bacterium]|nr:MAG: hydantoinase/oxoprolinase family protein [Spirochaetota bacterium]
MRVASDIGGTFTDLVYLDESTGDFVVGKSSTTPKNFALGVIDTLKKAKLDVGKTKFFVHGSTIIINALTERKGAKTGLITTRGFRDVLEITRANRPDLYNMYYTKPKPFVPRQYRLEVQERVNYKGDELEPLNEADVKKAAQYFKKEGIEAIAVCFLHSYANPSHERRCGELIRQIAPGIPVTLSCEITQEWREYERTNTAVLNSYVLNTAQHYLDNLEGNLSDMGMAKVYHVMQSNGGTATFEMGKRAPINMVESGPVGGVIGTAVIGKLIGEPNAISLDVGGTTAKTSLVAGGNPRITTEYKIEWRRDFAGYPILIPTVDIVEIGAGGGSIAWVDAAGALRVGPVSAGADPGPASYGWGGDKPTVTDANVLAGRINPDYFLGGEIPLKVDVAREAMNPVAKAFNIGIEEAAMGVIRLADSNMVNALKLVSVRRGYDPREFIMVAFGGGGAMHAGALTRELKVKKAVIPTDPAVFSAWGMLMTDLRQDFIKTLISRTDQIDPATITSFFADMEKQALDLMKEQNIAENQIKFQRFADMRYMGQEHTVKVPIPSGRLEKKHIPHINERFHKLHEHSYTFRLDTVVELVNYHLTAFGIVKKPELHKIDKGGLNLKEALKGERSVNFDELGFHKSPIYERDLLPTGKKFSGPMVIEEPASTTVVFPDQKVMRDEYGFLHIENT